MSDDRTVAATIQDAIASLQEILTGKPDPVTKMHAFATTEGTLKFLDKAKLDIEAAIAKVKPAIPAEG
jgi:hypothetical protein